MIKEAIKKIVNKRSLTCKEAFDAMNEIMNGETTFTQNASFLVASAARGVTANLSDEILGLAVAMRSHAMKIETATDIFEVGNIVENDCKSFDVATATAFVAAAGGLKTSLHGNRSISSCNSSANTFEALGANILIEPEDCVELLQNVGICFCFTPKYYSSMKFVSAIRQELEFETVFDILETLTNPAPPKFQLLGVNNKSLIAPLSEVLHKLKVERGMVVAGTDGLNLISMSASTSVCEFEGGRNKNYEISPEDFGMKFCQKSDLSVKDSVENAEVMRSVLSGEEQSPKFEAVLLNAGAAFYISDKVNSISEGIEFAKNLIESGVTKKKLEEFIEFVNA